MFCGWSQNFGAWGAVGRHTWWEWRRSVPSLCVLCYQSFQLRSHSIPWRLWFWQSPSVNGSMELFCSCRNLCVSILLESGGSEGVRVGLKAVERSGWKPWRWSCVCGVVTTVTAVTCCFWVLLLSLSKNKWVLPSFSAVPWIFFSPHFCSCKGINALFKCTSYKRGLVEYIKLYNEQK